MLDNTKIQDVYHLLTEQVCFHKSNHKRVAVSSAREAAIDNQMLKRGHGHTDYKSAGKRACDLGDKYEWDFSSCGWSSGFRFLSESNKDDIVMHFQRNFAPLRI